MSQYTEIAKVWDRNIELESVNKELLEALILIRKCIRNSRKAPNVLDTIDSVAQNAIVKARGVNCA